MLLLGVLDGSIVSVSLSGSGSRTKANVPPPFESLTTYTITLYPYVLIQLQIQGVFPENASSGDTRYSTVNGLPVALSIIFSTTFGPRLILLRVYAYTLAASYQNLIGKFALSIITLILYSVVQIDGSASPFQANMYSSVVYIATLSSTSYNLSVLRILGVLSVLTTRTLNPYFNSTYFFYT